ncbi:MAG TPA: hypothetical protein VMR66_00310 [Gemmatimonadota bacterium]|nr:hypothetical protein [Gemmatimonadota bacterium]
MRNATRQIPVGVGIFGVAIGVAFVDPRWSLLVFLLVPVLHILPGPIHMHWTR